MRVCFTSDQASSVCVCVCVYVCVCVRDPGTAPDLLHGTKRGALLESLVEGLEVGKLLEGGLLGKDLLVDEAAKADHGKAGVLELGELVTAHSSVVAAEVEGVEADVAGGAAVSEHVTGGDLAAVGEHLFKFTRQLV